jgi:hypothetical protein
MGDLLSLTLVSGYGQASTTVKRTGSYSYRATSATDGGLVWDYSVGDITEVYVRFGFYKDGPVNNFSYTRISFLNDGTTLAYFDIGSTSVQTPKAYVNAGLVATSSRSLVDDTWYLLEFYFKLDDAAGAMQSKINGVADIEYAGDTKPTTDAVFDTVRFKTQYNTAYQYFDDIAINDTNGSVDNSWCGDGYVVALKPNAIGDVTGLTNSAGTTDANYTFVDDIPSDGDTTYVYSSTTDLYDLYNLTATSLPANTVVTRVWGEARGKDPDAGNVAIVMQAYPTTDLWESTADSLTTAYAQVLGDYYTQNPATTDTWASTDLDNLQIGVKIL